MDKEQQLYTSNAQWPDGTIGTDGDVSTDTHGTYEFAAAICRRLERDGFGGDRKVFPIRTWVDSPTTPLPSLPDGLPPLPEPPAGHRWEYQVEPLEGTYDSGSFCYCYPWHQLVRWYVTETGVAVGENRAAYCLAIPTGTPLAQPEASDHRDCKDGCQYARETGAWPHRVCPVGECERLRREEPPARADGHAPREWDALVKGRVIIPILNREWAQEADGSFTKIRVREVTPNDELSAARAEAGSIIWALAHQAGHHPFCELYDGKMRCTCGQREELDGWLSRKAAALPQPTTESR